jgi:acyloxyacyl hydrolase
MYLLLIYICRPILIKMLQAKENPDVICKSFKFCKDQQCSLYPQTTTPSPRFYSTRSQVGSDPWWQKILDSLSAPFTKVFHDHTPMNDLDKDLFSAMPTFRGSDWRGKDCNDNSNGSGVRVYPGRKFNNKTDDPNIDNNCNGISGVDPVSGKSYEDLLCANTMQRGVAVIGDSASAHFRLPEQLIQGPTINSKTYSQLWDLIANEMDFPFLSTVTAFKNDTTGLAPGPVDSIYLRLKERNRCIHRDFQNIGVNGARASYSVYEQSTLSRNAQSDHPLLLFISLIGNDVCSSHKGFEHMTKPDEFYKYISQTLDALEQKLPPNSHVVFVGLAQGSMLYDFVANATHPLGVSYPAFYDWLNCMSQSPCWGWMNTNQTVRDTTTKIAYDLSQVYDKIIQDRQPLYKNFRMIYHEFPLKEMAKKYVEKGGKL